MLTQRVRAIYTAIKEDQSVQDAVTRATADINEVFEWFPSHYLTTRVISGVLSAELRERALIELSGVFRAKEINLGKNKRLKKVLATEGDPYEVILDRLPGCINISLGECPAGAYSPGWGLPDLKSRVNSLSASDKNVCARRSRSSG